MKRGEVQNKFFRFLDRLAYFPFYITIVLNVKVILFDKNVYFRFPYLPCCDSVKCVISYRFGFIKFLLEFESIDKMSYLSRMCWWCGTGVEYLVITLIGISEISADHVLILITNCSKRIQLFIRNSQLVTTNYPQY